MGLAKQCKKQSNGTHFRHQPNKQATALVVARLAPSAGAPDGQPGNMRQSVQLPPPVAATSAFCWGLTRDLSRGFHAHSLETDRPLTGRCEPQRMEPIPRASVALRE